MRVGACHREGFVRQPRLGCIYAPLHGAAAHRCRSAWAAGVTSFSWRDDAPVGTPVVYTRGHAQFHALCRGGSYRRGAHHTTPDAVRKRICEECTRSRSARVMASNTTPVCGSDAINWTSNWSCTTHRRGIHDRCVRASDSLEVACTYTHHATDILYTLPSWG